MTIFDIRELDAFVNHLDGVPPAFMKEARKSAFFAGMQIKRQLRNEMGRSSYFKGVTPSIDFEDIQSLTEFGIVAGPRKGGMFPGDLANIAYFGGSRGGGGTVPDPKGALEEEAPKFMAALLDIAGRLM